MIANAQRKTYIRRETAEKNLGRIATFFMFCYYVMPQYCGIDIKVFQLSVQRMAIIFVLIYIMFDRKKIAAFWEVIREHKLTPAFVFYLFVCIYTAAYRFDVGTFMYPFIEVLGFYVFVYLLKVSYTLEEILDLFKIFIWIICLEGALESVISVSLFTKLATMSGSLGAAQFRSGSFRIMGPANHSLGYGLLLLTATPLICIDVKRNKVDILNNKLLLLLLLYNVFMTGSRSTLAIFALEVFLLFLFCESTKKKQTFIYLLICILAIALVVVVGWGTKISNYIMLQITSIIDTAFETHYAASFGASEVVLNNSTYYRELLPRIFLLDTLSPIVGKGNGYSFSWYVEGYFISSIDNTYVGTYISLAYPGMIAFILVPLVSWTAMIKDWVKKRSGLAACLLVGSFVYYFNLWWVDTLQTIKYVYILFGLYFAFGGFSNTDSEVQKNISAKD